MHRRRLVEQVLAGDLFYDRRGENNLLFIYPSDVLEEFAYDIPTQRTPQPTLWIVNNAPGSVKRILSRVVGRIHRGYTVFGSPG